jgi:hypothetical protein
MEIKMKDRFSIFVTAFICAICALPATAQASDHLHRAACQQALLGANGDNDAQAFAPGYFSVRWYDGFTVRSDSDRLIVTAYLHFSYPHEPASVRAVGYCMGDDDHIVDKMGRGYLSRPEGWGSYPIYNGEVPG